MRRRVLHVRSVPGDVLILAHWGMQVCVRGGGWGGGVQRAKCAADTTTCTARHAAHLFHAMPALASPTLHLDRPSLLPASASELISAHPPDHPPPRPLVCPASACEGCARQQGPGPVGGPHAAGAARAWLAGAGGCTAGAEGRVKVRQGGKGRRGGTMVTAGRCGVRFWMLRPCKLGHVAFCAILPFHPSS